MCGRLWRSLGLRVGAVGGVGFLRLKRLDFQQEEGLMSSLPIGINQVEIERALTTSSTAVFIPFTTQELFQSGEALYYGLNHCQ